MSVNSLKSKTIAKNTLLLYGRMLIILIVNLYTSRVVLNALGVEDYGIYNVVGGVVAMFSIISGSLSAAISRFLTIELGKGDRFLLNRVFCSSVNVQLILIFILILLLESIGLWFLNVKLVIPLERLHAANWVFQFSILTFALNLWSVPYNSMIIAHEKMSVFALFGLFESFAKLAIAFLIIRNPIDRLVYYSVLLFLLGLLQRVFYAYYCVKNFEECKYRFIYDRQIVKEIFSFSGWNFIGAASTVLRDQGGNIIINIFSDPTVNAARGIAMSVNNAVSGFVTSFMTALNPQILKSYANGDYEYMFNIVYKGARFSYYILLLLSLPIIFSTHYLLDIWLGTVPTHADTFAQLILILTLTDSLANPLVTLMLATGDIKKYQLIVGGLQFLNVPLYYIVLSVGLPPESVFIISILVAIVCEVARLILLRDMVGLSVSDFVRHVIINVLCVTVIALVIPFIFLIKVKIDGLSYFIVISIITLISTSLSVFFIGCSKAERQMLVNYCKNIFRRFK